MSLLTKLTSLAKSLDIPSATVHFSEEAPDMYLVFTPLSDTLDLFADNLPLAETEEIRISLFSKGNYQTLKNKLTHALLTEGITITERRLIGLEEDTGFYHYSLDVADTSVR